MKIVYKLSISYGILLVILIGIIGLSLNGLSTLNTSIDDMAHDKFPKTVWANNIVDAINEGARALRNAALTKDIDERNKQIERALATTPPVVLYLDSLKRTIKSDEGKAILNKLGNFRQGYVDGRTQIIENLKSDSIEKAVNVMFGEFRKYQTGYLETVSELIDYQTQLMNTAAAEAEANYESLFMLMMIIALVAIIITVLLAVIVTKMITKPLSKAVAAADEISKGNMKVDLDSDSKDETGMLLNAMKIMAGNIDKLVLELNRVAGAAVEGKLDNRGNDKEFQGEYQNIIKGFNATLDAVIGPLNVTAEYVDRISKGDIPPKITDEYKGDFNEIKNNLNTCIEAIERLVKDATMLSQSAIEGKLDVRANASRHGGDFRAIVEGVNKTLDNVIGPLNVAAEYVDRIAKGDIPPKITDEYKGDFNEIKNNLNQAIDAITRLVTDAKMLAKAAVEGKLDTRANASKHGGDFKEIVEGVNATLDSVIGPLNVAAEYVDRIAKGDIPPKITDNYNGDFNEIKNNLNQAIDAITLLVTDAKMLAKAAIEGKLDTRANASKHQGDFRNIVEGVNATLDNVIGPLNVAAEYVDRIAKGDIPPKITDNYNGDFNEIKNNLNSAIDVMNGLLAETNMLIDATKKGLLDKRGDASKFAGDWGTLVAGVNDLITAFVAPINVTAEYVDRIAKGDIPPKITDIYHGDFNEIKNNLNAAIDVMNGLLTETNMLIDATKKGLLDKRGDASKFAGDWGTLVAGVNDLITAFVAPINVTAEYVDRIAKGDIPPKITDIYYGDFNEIKNNLNQCIDAVDLLVKDAVKLTQAAIDGTLDTRADASQHQGDFRKIVEGVNKTLDLVIEPIDEAGEVLSVMATGDLTVRMMGQYNGDLSKLKHDINTLADSLSSLILQVNEVVQTSASSAMEISATAEGLAAATQEQSSQSDEVASAVEEMSRTITENAMSANKTAEMAQMNGNIASEGSEVVSQTVSKMRDIATVVKNSAMNIEKLGDSSKQIGEIISVIDDIADQTNLLALNAAIEAARAGEQGRGFAVVADEVRKLAERTTEATKQIATMIKGIQNETQQAVVAMNKGNEEVSSGIVLADKAGSSLQQILLSTQELMDMINQIAAASEEQSATSEQISKNVMSISKVTSESAHRVEDVAHTSEDLAKLTEKLADLMSQFKVEAGNEFGSSAKQFSKRSGKQLTTGK